MELAERMQNRDSKVHVCHIHSLQTGQDAAAALTAPLATGAALWLPPASHRLVANASPCAARSAGAAGRATTAFLMAAFSSAEPPSRKAPTTAPSLTQ